MRRLVLAGSTLLLCATGAAAQRTQAESFTWAGELERGGSVHVRNVRGSVVVQSVDGDRVSVVADKRWTRSLGSSVRIEARRSGNDLIICALWTNDSPCTPLDAGAQPQGLRRSAGDVVVDFVVRVPRGTALRVVTLNGNVSIESASNDVEAQSVNGDVSVRTSAGSVYAATMNGAVTAVLLPPVDCDVELTSMRGQLRSEFAIAIRGRMEPTRVRGRIAGGGRLIRLMTVNGNLFLLRGSARGSP